MKQEISREALYDLVWQTPMVKLAPQFGLSGNGLARLCRREGIPVPERGYWAKLQHGKRMKRPPMKPSQSATETLTIEGTPSSRSSLESGMPKPLAELIKTEREFSQPIAVPRSPKLHDLVDSWPKPQKPTYGVPGLTQVAESRRRHIASVLFREIERRGGNVSANKHKPNDCHRFDIVFFRETIEVSFRERLNMVKVPPGPKRSHIYETTEWHPTGLLRLRFENSFDVPVRREWNDNETKRLEERLREILIALYIAVEAGRRRKERFRREAERRDAEERRRRERDERERREREAVANLLAEVTAWENAHRIRRYVQATNEGSRRKAEWIEWALALAD